MKRFFVLFFAISLVRCSNNLQADFGEIAPGEVKVTSETSTQEVASIGVPTSTSLSTSTPFISLTSTTTVTPTPSATATPTETTIPTITLTPTALPGQAYLSPMNHQWQTLNNCHRASIAILMAYYDVWFQQDDYVLGMDDLAEFVSEYGLTARIYSVRYAEIQANYVVRWLLAEGIPVIVGQRLSREDNTWHYRVIHGYNDGAGVFFVDDPLLGNIQMSYDSFDSLARGEGQVIPVYPQEMDEMVVRAMMGWRMKLLEYAN